MAINELWELAVVNPHDCFPLPVRNCPQSGTAEMQGLGARCSEIIHSKLNAALLDQLAEIFCFSGFFWRVCEGPAEAS